MTTWTCKGLIAGAALVALAGCDDIAGGLAGAPSGQKPATANNALRFANLGGGAVTLVPPAGFCIDKRTLRKEFALMARCDILGGATEFGTPVALITAAIVPQAKHDADRRGDAGEVVLQERTYDTHSVFQLEGRPPSADLRKVYWRAVGTVGEQVIGLALYEPTGGAELGERAPDMLSQTVRQTQDSSNAARKTAQNNSATAGAKPVTN